MDYSMAAARAFEAANVDYQAALIRLEAAEMELERSRLALEREKALHVYRRDSLQCRADNDDGSPCRQNASGGEFCSRHGAAEGGKP